MAETGISKVAAANAMHERTIGLMELLTRYSDPRLR
jgi:hypothetical protein